MVPHNKLYLWLISFALVVAACSKSDSSDKQAEDGTGQEPAAPKAATTPTSTPPVNTQAPPGKPGKKPPGDVAPPPEHSFITYNLGLIPAVGLERARLPLILEAMKKTRASVACLQEVWTDDDVKAITEGLAAYYPHAFSKATEDTGKHPSGVCDLGNAISTQKCGTEKCTPKGISMTECVSDAALCKAQYDGFSDACKRCLAANTQSPTRCAMGEAPRFNSQGRNGLLLLSWHEIENPTYTTIEAQIVARGAITATIQGRTVQCTHLSADLQVVPYPPDTTYQSWAEEHAAQIGVIDKAAKSDGCRVLLGDMNTGPTTEQLAGELEKNFSGLANASYVQPWDEPECTFCADNPLAGVTDDRWIDHIFFKGCQKAAAFEYRRVFDQPIQVQSEGALVDTRLSDHYGVMVTTRDL